MKKPNILLFFTDQQRADTIAALGNPVIQTPHMDRLCREGVSFGRAFTPSPVCVPARCSMFYGVYPHKSGCYDNNWPMPDDRPSIASALSDMGYVTHGIGKMHFTPDLLALRGFHNRERQEEIFGAPPTDYTKYLNDNGIGHIFDYHGQRSEMYYMPQLAQTSAEHHPTNWIGSRTCEFINNHDYSKPFFLMSSFIHPHPPFAVPTPWNKLYRSENMPLPHIPAESGDLTTWFNRSQNNFKYKDAGADDHLRRTTKAFYYACVSFIDYQIGRALDALKRRNQLENTLIVLTSDHGELLGDYGCYGKRTMLDPSARVPLVVRFPSKKYAGSRVNDAASLVDLFPTFVAAAGGRCGGMDLDGVDLEASVKGENKREYVFSQIQKGAGALYMVASKDKKYIYSAPDDKEYFLDYSLDPHETINFAANGRTHPDMAEMKQILLRTVAVEGGAVKDGGWIEYPPGELNPAPAYQDDRSARDRESVIPPGYTVDLR